MKHFNSAVSIELQNQVKAFAEAANEDFISDFKDSNGCSNVEPLFGIAQSGWIPMQLGGFTITEFYQNDSDPSYHFTKEQTDFNQKFYDDMVEDYKVDNDLKEIDYDDNDFQEWEVDLFDSAMLRLVVYVDNGGLVKVEFSVNYKDAPYFRLQADQMLKEMTFTEEEFLKVDFDEIFEQLKNYK